MRIGLVTGEYPPMQGGVGAFSAIIAREFVQLGQPVFVFSSTAAQQQTPTIPVTNSVRRWHYGAIRRLNAWAQQQQIDVLNLQYQTAAYQMSPWIHALPRLARVPVVTTFHDLRFPYLFPKAGQLRDAIVMLLARTSAAAIVTNHEDYARINHLPGAALIPIGSNILTELPPAYDRADWQARAGGQADDLLLAYFGFMNHSKGLEPLLTSLATLRRAHIPARLVLIGGRTGTSDPTNAAYANHIDAQIAALGLNEAVHWTGFVDEAEVAAYLRAADIVALPFLDGASYRRGSLMAALHHGCAIVTTTPQVGIPTFQHGTNLWLVPPDDSAALSAAITTLYQQPELRQQLQAGAAALRQEFAWTRIAQATVATLAQARQRA